MNQIQLTNALLSHTRPVDHLSSVLLLITIGVVCMTPFMFSITCMLLVTGLIGLFLKYAGLRLSFDRHVFAHFSQLSPEQLATQTAHMDSSLAALKLISIHSSPDWDERCQSTIRLIRTQFVLCCLQALLLLFTCSLRYV